jgi:S1-C subfamily serine protease
VLRRLPDWAFYAAIALLIYLNAARAAQEQYTPQPAPPPELGAMLPRESPRDATVIVDLEPNPSSSVGTAFVIDESGRWLTARHVVDGCDKVGLKIGTGTGLRTSYQTSPDSDTAILRADWRRDPLPTDLYTQRQLGEYGYFIGFPQGKAGEVIGSLMGRNKMIIRGRYRTEEPILAWTEVGRSRGLKGSLGGLSGGPVMDSDGEVIGLVAAESPRRGRIYTVAPKTLKDLVRDTKTEPVPIDTDSYGKSADRYRRNRQIAQVMCFVE